MIVTMTQKWKSLLLAIFVFTILLCTLIGSKVSITKSANLEAKTEALVPTMGLMQFSGSTLEWLPMTSPFTFSTPETGLSSIESLCNDISPTPEECKTVADTVMGAHLEFPQQFVSGTPGSGNDWILWLASPYRRDIHTCSGNWQFHLMADSMPPNSNHMKIIRQLNQQPLTDCLYLKTHKPWGGRNNEAIYNTSVRTALLLRHPYDAAFAEYKRELVVDLNQTKSSKSAVTGLTVNMFINPTTNISNPTFLSFLRNYGHYWLDHMRYWLTEYSGELHVLIYNNVKSAPVKEVTDLKEFFGYQLNDESCLRDHCCKMKDTANKALKRQPSVIDEYKDTIYRDVREQFEELVKETNNRLAALYPSKHLVLGRG